MCFKSEYKNKEVVGWIDCEDGLIIRKMNLQNLILAQQPIGPSSE